jgi:hypothetical protein
MFLPDYGWTLTFWADCGYEAFNINGSSMFLFVILLFSLFGVGCLLKWFIYNFWMVD